MPIAKATIHSNILREEFKLENCHVTEDEAMLAVGKHAVALYANRTTQQWIVRDPEGIFWVVPSGEDAWNQRAPFQPTDETELEPLPGHYKYLLQLPF